MLLQRRSLGLPPPPLPPDSERRPDLAGGPPAKHTEMQRKRARDEGGAGGRGRSASATGRGASVGGRGRGGGGGGRGGGSRGGRAHHGLSEVISLGAGELSDEEEGAAAAADVPPERTLEDIETADEKRVRLAKAYLGTLARQAGGEEEEGEEEEEEEEEDEDAARGVLRPRPAPSALREAITKRLQQDAQLISGAYFRPLAARLRAALPALAFTFTRAHSVRSHARTAASPPCSLCCTRRAPPPPPTPHTTPLPPLSPPPACFAHCRSSPSLAWQCQAMGAAP